MEGTWTMEMLMHLDDAVMASRISEYAYCGECAVKVDTFVLTCQEDAQHYCDVCGSDVAV